MEYELLSKIFYKKPTEYESIYDARFNSEASIKLPIKIHETLDSFSIRMKLQSYWLKYIKQSTKSIC